jgi:hypothetical protein
MPCDTKYPPFAANEPVLTSSKKSIPLGAGAGDGEVELSLEQLEASPAIHAGSNAAAAPNPTLEKKSFLFILIIFFINTITTVQINSKYKRKLLKINLLKPKLRMQYI